MIVNNITLAIVFRSPALRLLTTWKMNIDTVTVAAINKKADGSPRPLSRYFPQFLSKLGLQALKLLLSSRSVARRSPSPKR